MDDFGPKIFRGRAPKFLDLHCLIAHISHHVVKFYGDQLRELRDIAQLSVRKINEKKNNYVIV